ncbi:hypothetical protein BMG03_06465 [Thioclava nitratireducens]|uniref:Uncharacterized protein n=1 Tax=Thioclava nitratireducens TaxID=1915078 RepID=A0ABN4X4S4_9RHOB|nr:hypothetical protein [Thioclava nitratireducens]AQS47481.1 hypothetical protein BMG03_06465 [Thioclava nitratireducens]
MLELFALVLAAFVVLPPRMLNAISRALYTVLGPVLRPFGIFTARRLPRNGYEEIAKCNIEETSERLFDEFALPDTQERPIVVGTSGRPAHVEHRAA